MTYCVKLDLISHTFEKLPKLESISSMSKVPQLVQCTLAVHHPEWAQCQLKRQNNGFSEGLASWNTGPKCSVWTKDKTGISYCLASPLSSPHRTWLACLQYPQVANFLISRKVQPGNGKGSQNVPAFCAYRNTPGSTNFRFSSAVTAKLQHQLIHNQWAVSVFMDCVLGSQGEAWIAFNVSIIIG